MGTLDASHADILPRLVEIYAEWSGKENERKM